MDKKQIEFNRMAKTVIEVTRGAAEAFLDEALQHEFVVVKWEGGYTAVRCATANSNLANLEELVKLLMERRGNPKELEFYKKVKAREAEEVKIEDSRKKVELDPKLKEYEKEFKYLEKLHQRGLRGKEQVWEFEEHFHLARPVALRIANLWQTNYAALVDYYGWRRTGDEKAEDRGGFLPFEEDGMVNYTDEFQFLEELRESGVINMYGAAPYLEETYGITKEEARYILKLWMKHYDELNEMNGWQRVGDSKGKDEFKKYWSIEYTEWDDPISSDEEDFDDYAEALEQYKYVTENPLETSEFGYRSVELLEISKDVDGIVQTKVLKSYSSPKPEELTRYELEERLDALRQDLETGAMDQEEYDYSVSGIQEELRDLDRASGVKGRDSHYTEFDETIADAHHHVEERDASGYPHVDDIIIEALEMYPEFADKKYLLDMSDEEKEWRNFRSEVKKALRRLKLPYTNERDELVKGSDARARNNKNKKGEDDLKIKFVGKKTSDAESIGEQLAEVIASELEASTNYDVELNKNKITTEDATYTFGNDGSVHIKSGGGPREKLMIEMSDWEDPAAKMNKMNFFWLWSGDEILEAKIKSILAKIKPTQKAKTDDAKSIGQQIAHLFVDWAEEYTYVRPHARGKRVAITIPLLETTIYHFGDDGSVRVDFSEWTKYNWAQTGMDKEEIARFKEEETNWPSIIDMLNYSELSWIYETDGKEELIKSIEAILK